MNFRLNFRNLINKKVISRDFLPPPPKLENQPSFFFFLAIFKMRCTGVRLISPEYKRNVL